MLYNYVKLGQQIHTIQNSKNIPKQNNLNIAESCFTFNHVLHKVNIIIYQKKEHH